MADTSARQASGTGSERASIFAALAGAVAMTSCCILPLVAFTLGASGAWVGRMSALYVYRPYFLAFAAAALAWGFWRYYGPPSRVCAPGSLCADPRKRAVMRGALWLALAVVLFSLAFPWIATTYLMPF